MSRAFHSSRFASSRFRAEKEEIQLSTLSSPVLKVPVDPKPAFTKHITPAAAVETRPKVMPAVTVVENRPKPQPAITAVEARTKLQPAITAFSPLQENKKSLVVNGNGHRVRTMISREAIEQNGLHL